MRALSPMLRGPETAASTLGAVAIPESGRARCRSAPIKSRCCSARGPRQKPIEAALAVRGSEIPS